MKLSLGIKTAYVAINGEEGFLDSVSPVIDRPVRNDKLKGFFCDGICDGSLDF
ncbi:MAG: hypothetical protein WC768_02530 [Patescibacteria group bacterium]